jgi:SAM-dependent methyltransferase
MLRVEDEWATEARRVASSFDRIADLYRARFQDELEHKPLDREILGRATADLPPGLEVLEVGAGPAQISSWLARRGVPVVASDVSLGQLREAASEDRELRLVAADLAHLPVRTGCLAGIVAFYCLIYGRAELLDAVFAEWGRSLRSGGIVVLAVHAGEGAIANDEWEGRPVDITVVLRDPDDIVARLRRHGFSVREKLVRPPYGEEFPTDRCYVVAVRG